MPAAPSQPTFSTNTKIRIESGFINNTDITDPTIDLYRYRAYGVVNSTISPVYRVQEMISSPMYEWSHAQTIIESCETLLASWYLLTKQYGIDQMWYGNDEAKDKIDEANSMLKQIAKWNMRLYGTDGLEFQRTEDGATSLSLWPVASTPRESRNFTSTREKF